MRKPILVWSFASLDIMDQAIECIRYRFSWSGAEIRGQLDGNLYVTSDKVTEDDISYITGICRGVAHALRDKSIFC